MFFGVGNTYTTATLLEPRRGADGVGDNDGLFTNATLALRPRTGELVWYHQHHHQPVYCHRLGHRHEAHQPGARAGGRQELLLCPGNLGGRNWPATSFNAATGTLFVPMTEACAGFTYEPRSRAETAGGGSDIRFTPSLPPGNDGNLGRIMALDLATRSVRWTQRQRMPMAGSLLATAGGLVLGGDLGRGFAAFDQDSGERLWQTRLPAAAESNAITYAVDGRQYIAVVAGEASHLGTHHRRLVPELGAANTIIELIVFELPRE